MRGKNTVILNGQAYDALSGLPLPSNRPVAPSPTAVPRTMPASAPGKIISDFGPVRTARRPSVPAVSPPPAATTTAIAAAQHAERQRPHPAAAVHRLKSRSHTLNRQALKKPEIIRSQAAVAVSRSPLISKFGNHFVNNTPMVAVAPPAKATRPTAAAVKTPQRVTAASVAGTSAAATLSAAPPLSGSLLKEQLIRERLSQVHPATSVKPKAGRLKGLKRLARLKARSNSLAVIVAGLLLFGGYLAYVNLPNLSVRVASARAGVSASYPQYSPDGYRFAGPVAYSPGEVTIRFRSNTNSQSYKIEQRASNWDSQAVLDNLVTKESNSYLTYSEQGLTVYTFNNKAAWVNGGVLYVVSGDAPLSSDQLLRIAASM